jgi:hypothetical protein
VTVAALLCPATAARAAFSPAIRHVFVLVLENESASSTFGAHPPAPYLARTLTGQGAYLPNYYGIGHASNDNYIAMISGQAPNPQTQGDCPVFSDFQPGLIGPNDQAVGSGCVFPTDVKTVADQLEAAGLTWRDYNQSMGADPSRESAQCGHPGVGQPDRTESATATDQYATRHDPFVYFHSIIDNTARCNGHVVSLNLLSQDLASAASTPNFVFITPDLCSDGHDATCADPHRPGGYAGIEQFLEQWVPRITGSPAYQQQNGLLAIVFDEAASGDSSACCGEIAGPDSPSPGGGGGTPGPGGGDTGAVLLSPCIRPGTVSKAPYNHYTLLRSIEDIFGLAHLGYAGLPGETSWGSDVFRGGCASAPTVSLRVPALASRQSIQPLALVRWSASPASGARFTLQVRQTSAGGRGWRTLLRNTTRRYTVFRGRPGATYRFQLQAIGASGLSSLPATGVTVMPSVARVPGGRFRGTWRPANERGAWLGQALVGAKGAQLDLTYSGASIQLIGSLWPRGATAVVVVDHSLTTLQLSTRRPFARQVIFSRTLAPGRHHLSIAVRTGILPLEGIAITDRRR